MSCSVHNECSSMQRGQQRGFLKYKGGGKVFKMMAVTFFNLEVLLFYDEVTAATMNQSSLSAK